MERVRRLGVDDELALLGRRAAAGEGRLHLVDRVQRDPGIGRAVQTEHRAVEFGRQVHRMGRRQRTAGTDQPPIPRDSGLHRRAVCAVQPGDAPTPAKARDRELAGVGTLRLGPRGGGIEVTHHLRIGHLGDHLGDQLGDLAIRAGITLAHEQLRRDREVARLRKAPRDVGDVFMHAEDLAHHQHHRCVGLARRRRAIRRHLEVAHRDRHLAGDEAGAVGLDRRLRDNRQHRGGKATAHRGAHEVAAAEIARRREAVQFLLQHVASVGW